MSPHHPTPLKFLMPGWFAIVMGLSGLSLAWKRAEPLMGEAALAASLAIGILAALAFATLAVLSILRMQRYAQALAEDMKHPVRHAFIAAIPISLILLATVLHALEGPHGLTVGLWMLGSVVQFGVTVWVLSRWLNGNKEGGMVWAGVTPVLFIPVVGNVLVPLAGVGLGYPQWSAAQFGVGIFFWPVVMTLLVVRMGTMGMWPDRLLPTTFIAVAPPAVGGLAAMQLGAPETIGWLCWGIGLFFLMWAGSVTKRILTQPFAITFWAISFPLASFAALTLRLSPPAGFFTVIAMMTLALSSVVIAGLALATYKGLRQGHMLAPEPVATITPV
ncbi:MAG: SLAC1 anion channel family protein [Betaproteobacteria bacterium]|jgi:tellurite resistance protein|nr:SLAC1 anion channel family protein [Betaproteobacteria bacterium]MBP6644491.1 SLAC1 anion channel family protein [Burkholderiaceae bacterium]